MVLGALSAADIKQRQQMNPRRQRDRYLLDLLVYRTMANTPAHQNWNMEHGTYFNFKLQALNRVGDHLLIYLERPFVSYVDNL